MFAIGAAALAEFDLRAEARPTLEQLAKRFGDTAFLMVPEEAGAVCIDRVEGGKPLVVAGIGIGSVLPYHAAAAPVAMVAFDPQLRARVLAGPLPAFTARTHVNAEEFARHLDRVRADGGRPSAQCCAPASCSASSALTGRSSRSTSRGTTQPLSNRRPALIRQQHKYLPAATV